MFFLSAPISAHLSLSLSPLHHLSRLIKIVKISLSFKNNPVTPINHGKQLVSRLQAWEPGPIGVWPPLELTSGRMPTAPSSAPGDRPGLP